MAMPGQLKVKIDQIKKKIETGGASQPAERQRLYRKRLKRLQRSRRVALTAEKKLAERTKKATKETAAGEAPAATPAS
jgi:hypothetical protein